MKQRKQRKQIGKLMMALGLSAILILGGACDTGGEDDETTTLAGLALAYQSLTTKAFVDSCDITASKICSNSFGTSSGAAGCATVSGTYSTSRCTSTNAIGSCTTSSGTNETVYYTTNVTCADDAACLTICNTIGGTYNADYTGL